MTFKRYAEFAARARVPAGFLVLALYAVFSAPAPGTFMAGVLTALAGIALRAWAAGHLAKNERLAVSGPYAYTRNPLYLGSALVAAGFAVAGGSWWLALLLAVYFIAFFLPVVIEEESHLSKLFPEFQGYAAAVPRFGPRLLPARVAAREEGARFRWALYLRNQEYNALLGYLFGVALLIWKLR